MIAVPRSSAASEAARAGKAALSRANMATRTRSAGLMPPLTPRPEAYSSKKAPHVTVKRLLVRSWISAGDDPAPAGHAHPSAVLLADGVDAAEAGNGITGIDFVRAPAAFDQRAAI